MRSSLFVGGAAVGLLGAVLAAVSLGARGEVSPPRAPELATSAAAAENTIDSRQLGFRLLAISNPDEVRRGLESLTKAADGGDVEAQVSLGRIYLQGIPAAPKDVARARVSFERANRAHHPSAAYFLGVMSQNGEGAPPDAAAAARWLDVAARAGSPHAMFLLANAYRAGNGVPRNDARALELYAKAGELEHAAALQTLAMAYLRGELGLEPDEAESRRYSMEAEHAIKHPPSPP